VGLRRCPFLELAEARAQVVGPVHLGLMPGAMDAWGTSLTVHRLDPFAEPDLCVAHLSAAGPAA
jgi:predicted ArsR family transcriptional regulator